MATLPELTTARLRLRRLELDDAPFALELLNEPAYIRFIADRGVRTLEDARRYLQEGPLAMYERHGFGLWHVARIADGEAIGMCGLLRREVLPDVDIGYAYLARHGSQGYAFEAAAAVLALGTRRFGLKRVIGVVSEDNAASIRVLEKLGMRFERMYPMHADQPEVRLYAVEFPACQ